VCGVVCVCISFCDVGWVCVCGMHMSVACVWCGVCVFLWYGVYGVVCVCMSFCGVGGMDVCVCVWCVCSVCVV